MELPRRHILLGLETSTQTNENLSSEAVEPANTITSGELNWQEKSKNYQVKSRCLVSWRNLKEKVSRDIFLATKILHLKKTLSPTKRILNSFHSFHKALSMPTAQVSAPLLSLFSLGSSSPSRVQRIPQESAENIHNF